MSKTTSIHLNRLKQRFCEGTTSHGAQMMLSDLQIAEELGDAGLDYVYIDQQHGHTDSGRLPDILRAIPSTRTTPLVRVACNAAADIAHALDAGAEGVIVPDVKTPPTLPEPSQSVGTRPSGLAAGGRSAPSVASGPTPGSERAGSLHRHDRDAACAGPARRHPDGTGRRGVPRTDDGLERPRGGWSALRDSRC